jgi:hypothetical protein
VYSISLFSVLYGYPFFPNPDYRFIRMTSPQLIRINERLVPVVQVKQEGVGWNLDNAPSDGPRASLYVREENTLMLLPGNEPQPSNLQAVTLPTEAYKFSYTKQNKLRDLCPSANYTDRATATCRRSWCQLLRIEGVTRSA